ncbi:MAG: preprotein translocase subunit SecE [Phycisphaerales bacterium]|nr:preprotein translocase subunit SecE [Phycisphaerales bacterium]
MAFGLYKPGQGYWVRVLTAVGAGIVTLYAAAWGWNQAAAVRLPAKAWTISVQSVQGSVQPGETLELLHFARGETLVSLGSARVTEFGEGAARRGTIVIEDFDSTETRDRAGDSYRVLVGDPLSPSFRAQVTSASATPVIPQLYLQAIVAGTIILTGTLMTGFFVALSRRSADFLIATDAEMKKVNWTTYKHVKGSTIVVIVASFLIAGILFIVDLGFSSFFKMIGVLEG